MFVNAVQNIVNIESGFWDKDSKIKKVDKTVPASAVIRLPVA